MYTDAGATHKKLPFSAEAQILGKAKQVRPYRPMKFQLTSQA